MKCPKCGYLGFDDVDRCKNCGYTFALSSVESPVPRLPPRDRPPLRDSTSHGLPDPAEAGARRGRPHPAAPRAASAFDRTIQAPPDSGPLDLPLFDVPEIGAPRPTPPARPPLSVRKATPSPTRVRQRYEQSTPTELDLGFQLPSPSSVGPDAGPAPPVETLPTPARGERTGPARRVLAALIDVTLMAAIDLAVLYFTIRIAGLAPSEVGLLPRAPLAAFFLLLDLGYVWVFTGTVGQTLGKMATGIAVVPDDRSRLDLGRSALRTACSLVTVATLGLGFLPALLGEERSLHDRLARTRVFRRAS